MAEASTKNTVITKRKACDITIDVQTQTPTRLKVSNFNISRLLKLNVEDWKSFVVRVVLSLDDDPLFKAAFYLKRSDNFMKLKHNIEKYQVVKKAKSYSLYYLDSEGDKVRLRSDWGWYSSIYPLDDVSSLHVYAKLVFSDPS